MSVQSVYVESQSSPDEERFVFAYTVTIRNRGGCLCNCSGVTGLSLTAMAVKSKFRVKVWLVNSPIAPGEEYQYTSGAVIETPLGTMQGHYEMVDVDGNVFRVAIPVFRLAVTTLIH